MHLIIIILFDTATSPPKGRGAPVAPVPRSMVVGCRD